MIELLIEYSSSDEIIMKEILVFKYELSFISWKYLQDVYYLLLIKLSLFSLVKWVLGR